MLSRSSMHILIILLSAHCVNPTEFVGLWEGIDTGTYVQNALNRRANTLMKPRQLDGSKNTTDSDLESDGSESGFSQTSDEKYDSDSNGSVAGSDLDGVMVGIGVQDCCVIILIKPFHFPDEAESPKRLPVSHRPS